MSAQPRETRVAEPLTMHEIVFPSDLNPHGTMFGGKVVAVMDICATLCASRWSNRPVVTASIDAIQFSAPIRQGQMIEVTARMVYVSRTSCVAKVEVRATDLQTGDSFECCEGYFNIVAVDTHGKPVGLPMLAVETDEQRAEWELAKEIKETLLARRDRRSS
jgi:acyl-CoA hydrolase